MESLSDRDERNIQMIDIVEFEIGSVKACRWLTPSEKEAKIKQLKALVPNNPKFKDDK
jgi:hypothetical protein